jgi:hypothetical protein
LPKDITGVIGIIVVAFFSIFVSVNFQNEGTRQNDLVSSMTSSVQQAAIQSFDKSSRVQRGLVKIDTSKFQTNFKNDFKQNTNVNLSKTSFKFDYLKDGENVKAVRVTLTDDRGQKYTATVAVDVNDN